MLDTRQQTRPALLGTKLYIPATRTDIVRRSRLTELLNSSVNRKLTLVSAPAGFGKTTLMSEWIPQSRRCVTWLSLDRNDNEPVRFWMYVVGALQSLDETLGGNTLLLLQSPEPQQLDTVISRLINEITAFPDTFALVLDDYHVIENPAIHESLAFFLDQLPRNMHLIILSRADPVLPLPRLRARQEMTEVRVNDLRFTHAESSAFFQSVMRIAIGDEDVSALDHRTEGWVAGLQLAALSMQGQDVHSFVKAFTGDDRYILDYLIEEVFRRQPEEVQTFLMHTSVVDRLSGSLCDALTGGSEGVTMLARLEQTNLFLFPLDNVREWYRYHHLFADLLRMRLQRRNPDTLLEMHRRASAWFEHNGLMEEAIQHALAGREWERSARLIHTMALKMLSRWQHGILERWIRALPEQVLEEWPYLCVSYAFVFMHIANFDRCEEYLRKAEKLWKDEPPDHHLCSVWSIRSMAWFARGNPEETLAAAHHAVRYARPDNFLEQSLSLLSLSVGLMMHARTREAEETLRRTLVASEKAGHLIVHFSAWMYIGYIQLMRGELHLAMETLQRSVAQGSLDFPESAITSHSLLCSLALELNELDAAERHCQECIAIQNRTGGLRGWPLLRIGLRAVVWVLVHRGEKEQAALFVEREIELAHRHRNGIAEREARSIRALMALWDGDIAAAGRWAETVNLGAEDDFSFGRETAHLTYIRILLSREEYDQAISLARHLRSVAEAGSRARRVIELGVLEALAYAASGRMDAGISLLADLLQRSEREGYVRVFVDEGAPMVDLLRGCVRMLRKEDGNGQSRLEGYIARLLASFPDEMTLAASRRRETPADLPPAYLLDPLSEREIEVLHHMATGLANAGIGKKLFISTGTVKRHVNNIYTKLNVHSRMEAVAKAKELKVLTVS